MIRLDPLVLITELSVLFSLVVLVYLVPVGDGISLVALAGCRTVRAHIFLARATSLFVRVPFSRLHPMST